ncbi:MAG TPA: peroxidase family protein, partial [Ornithinibacter sp.]|nr:peroxidase family protein [Ornithinibacter sp.]
GGMATWADVKAQADDRLGIALTDADALSIPLLVTDPYGRFMRGPNGLPQMVLTAGPDGILDDDPDTTDVDESADNNALVEGNLDTPVSTAGMTRTGHAFLDDIAHNAVPKSGFAPDGDDVVTPGLMPCERPNVPENCVNEYDDEMLDAHFIAGDGRVNENIGLTAVHHVFHSEHNRLVEEINSMIVNTENVAGGITDAEEADWKATNRYIARDGGYDYGERLFQAARFVTEMEYQHLAFEEFIRKVQPMVAPFGEGGTGYNTSINAAIKAEFAHAVYRFGHSMLTESVDRIRADGTRDDIDLLNAFLNPPSFQADGRTPEQAAGDVVRGMTRQVGNELDEFVTEALRNQLLGLPLDLASLNMARARDTGIPTLNAARRSFYEASNNSALAPYQSWADFGFSIKHAESLNNFIAAYGTHSSITEATTMAAKRAAADRILAGPAGADGILVDDENTPVDETADNGPADSYAFLNSANHEVTDPDTGITTVVHSDWVTTGPTNTGVDRIDLWVGGLAEKQMVFGGLLGPTFNYVFEAQMEDLQFGDRFYYLSRTAGLNMLTQLEGNSFAELIQRNTDVEGLPADSFSRPAYVFNLAVQNPSGPILDDPATEWNEASLLTRMPDGTIRYGGPEHVVFNGTAGNNRVWSSEGDDTIRGNDGNDWMQGGDGNDNHIGGLGDDILLDTNGDDTLKGGDGNDTLSSGQGFAGDLNQGGRGNDFIDHDDMAEAFAGPGDDYVLGGPEDDTVFGDDGDDWLENGASVNGTGGGAFNLLQGDNGAPFQDDPNEPGHDVLIGYGGENDNDAEGGDDVMLNGPGIQRNEGMLGFDYATHDGDPVAADSDLDLTGLLPPSVETNKDRFDLVEALSGWTLNDTLRGDDRDTAAMVGHELTAEGTARVTGLEAVLGATTFTGGNVLMGGGGADLIEGRGGDDVIDGDAQLNVRISVRSVADPTQEIDSVQTLSGVAARMINGTINPGQLRIVREIQTPSNGTSVDVALFSDVRTNYVITRVDDNTVTVAHTGGLATDGTDTVSNVETLRFTDQDVATSTIAAPAPAAELSTTSLAFGLRDTGTTATLPVVVTNSGTADLTVSGATVTPAGTAFSVSNNGCTAPVAPAGTCTITVAFAPTATGTQTATLEIAHDGAGSPATVSLTGEGQTPVVVVRPVLVAPATVDFGRRAVGSVRTQSVRVTNNGPGTVTFSGVTTSGPFTATLGNCPVAPATLAVGRSCNLSVSFRPTQVGPVTGSLTVTSNAVGSPQLVNLTGIGR